MLHLALWLVQKTHTTHSTNQIKDLNQSRHGYPLFPALQAACWFFTLISHLSIAIFSSVLLYTPLKPLFVFLTGFSASPSWSRRINGGWALLSKVSAGGNGQQVRKLGTLTMSKFMDVKTRKGALAQIPLPPPNISASSNAEQTTTRLLWDCVPRICCKIDRSRRSPTPVWNLRFGARSTADNLYERLGRAKS